MIKTILPEGAIGKDFILKVAMGVALMLICAKIYIPLKPVPITFHTAGALMIAFCFRRKEAMSIICGFTFAGILGAPISTGMENGLVKLMGPSGGYYWGMIAAVFAITSLKEKFGDETYFKLFSYGIIGSIFIYIFGLAQLSLFVGADKALALGLYPFILTGITKNIITSGIVKYIKR